MDNVQTPGGNTTTAGAVEGLAKARRICAAHYRARARNPKNSYGHEMAHAERIINGDSDDWDCVQTTLAAIIETTEAEDRRIVAWLKSEYASSSASGEIPINAVSMIDTIRRLIEEGAHRQ